MKTTRQIPADCVALDGLASLFAEGEAATATFEREIGLTGDYKSRKFSLDRAQFLKVIENHKASGVDPCVDRGHETWLGADPGTEARGWVKELTVRPSTLRPGRDALVAKIELNDLGLHAVANRHFQYVSMGLNLKGTDKMTGEPIGPVLDHLALVKRPQIEGMPALTLSADEPTTEEKPMKSVLLALGVKEDATEEQAIAALTSKLTEGATALSAAHAEVAALKAQNTASDVRLKALEDASKAANTARLTALLDAKIAAFAVDPSERAALLELAAVSAEIFEKTIALRTPRNPSGPALTLVKGNIDLLSLQQKAITEYIAANPGADEMSALTALSSEKPELFKEVV